MYLSMAFKAVSWGGLFFAIRGLHGPARDILEIGMQASSVVTVVLESDGSPRLLGHVDAVFQGVKTWEYLVAVAEWQTVEEIGAQIGTFGEGMMQYTSARSDLQRLHEYGLLFKDASSRRRILFRAVGIEADMSQGT